MGKSKDPNVESLQNPALMWLPTIKAAIDLRKKYNGTRLTMDSAKDAAHKAAEKAKVPGKDQDTKDKVAELKKEEETVAIADCVAAKDALLVAINGLLHQRDEKFRESIDAMCEVLRAMTPDWNVAGEDEKKSYADAPTVEKDDEKTLDYVGEGAATVATSSVPAGATDSESD